MITYILSIQWLSPHKQLQVKNHEVYAFAQSDQSQWYYYRNSNGWCSRYVIIITKINQVCTVLITVSFHQLGRYRHYIDYVGGHSFKNSYLTGI